MQYRVVFFSSEAKIENFIGFFYIIFNMFTQNIDCRYTLEPLIMSLVLFLAALYRPFTRKMCVDIKVIIEIPETYKSMSLSE